jgi:hypothetical protein
MFAIVKSLPWILSQINSIDPFSSLGREDRPLIIIVCLCIGWLMSFCKLWCLVINHCTYSSHSDRKKTKLLIAALHKTTRPKLVFGEVLVDEQTVFPAVVLAAGFAVITQESYLGLAGDKNVQVTVYRWRWLPPLVEPPKKPEQLDPTDDNTLTVLENTSNNVGQLDVEEFVEVAISRHVPDSARRRAMTCAEHILRSYTENNCESQTYVICGQPGSGKSMTVRAAAMLLNGVLYSDYDPTRAGECMFQHMTRHSSPDVPLVIAFEEFDIALGNIARGIQVNSDHHRLDAHDKASWNRLLDRVARKRYLVVIMTTNVLPDQLVTDVCRGDISLLRKGRVTQFVVMNNDTEDVRYVEPFGSHQAPDQITPLCCRADGDTGIDSDSDIDIDIDSDNDNDMVSSSYTSNSA